MTEAAGVSPMVELPRARKKIDCVRFAPGSDEMLLVAHGGQAIEVWDLSQSDGPMYAVEPDLGVAGARFWPDEGGLLVWSGKGALALDLASDGVVARVSEAGSAGGALRAVRSVGAAMQTIPIAVGGAWVMLPMLVSGDSARAYSFVSADVSCDAGTLFAVAHSHRVYAYALHSGEQLREWKLPMNERSSLVCLPSGHVAVGTHSRLVILDPQQQKPIFSRTAHLSGVRGLVQMPGGLLATFGENRNMRLWTGRGERSSGLIRLRKQVREAFPIDGTRLLACATNRRLYLIDVQARPAMVASGRERVRCEALAVSDDGGRVALAGVDRVVRVYEASGLAAQLAGV